MGDYIGPLSGKPGVQKKYPQKCIETHTYCKPTVFLVEKKIFYWLRDKLSMATLTSSKIAIVFII